MHLKEIKEREGKKEKKVEEEVEKRLLEKLTTELGKIFHCTSDLKS